MTADTPCAARLPSAFLYECGTLPGNASTSPAAKSKRSPATKIVTSPARHVKNSRVPGRCGAAHRRAGRELHHVEQFLRHAFRDQRPYRHAAAAALTCQFCTRPLAHLGARRGQQLIERHAKCARDFHEHGERWVAAARLQVGNGRARHTGRFRQRALGEVAHVPERNQVAREMGCDELGSIHKVNVRRVDVRPSDIPPSGWTSRLVCR